ncbi:serine/threonine-protein kinase [Curtobacterium sp. MCPF17_046]|uniref:serine/threonine-protein kinase n=1 Tax=Curtobacterium sp. MCPF17_046 TaxID=2175663 RepID=UPI000D880C52|nr:serine/threonine-protein kinase [Curtobacterium sp. MCPF17_046]PYY41460.1 serine/threonine protein kinase [Curtobacterium sp. MCPF17_046]
MEERLIGGRYRVTGTLGHGGMASVYRAVDEQLGREVAVKLFRIGPVDHGERARAEAEIHVLAGLRSPNLVTLFDAALDTADGDSFLVMELVPGSDLATRLREGPLDTVTTARVGAQVAEGLAAVHAQGIVHRDVKPANVLLEQDGEHVKLADFGIALLRDAARVTGTGTVIGTAAYLAPEQVLGQPVTGEADVYALGLMLLEALTGKQAFPGSAVEAATARLARAPEIDQHLPTAWRTLLHVMTAQHPEDRPSAAEAAARLRALGRDDVAPATQLLPGGPGALTKAAAAGGAVGAAAAAGAGAASADAATRAMPVSGASDADTATRRLPTQSARSADDDVATTVLGTPAGAGAGAGAAGGAGGRTGTAAVPAGPSGSAPEERERKRWVLPVIVLAVLLVAGVLVAALALGRDDGTPAPTRSSEPAEQQPTEDQSSEPAEEQPSEPAEQQPSEPAEQQPSEPAEQQPSEPAEEQPSEPAEELPSSVPEPSVETSLPVEEPLDTGVDTTSQEVPANPGKGTGNGGPGGGPGSGPGKSGDAPGRG